MNFYLLVTSSFKSLFSSFNSFILIFRVVISSVLILQSCSLFMVVSFFNDRSSSMKYDITAIIFPHSFDSRDSNLAFREEYTIVRIRGVAFIPAIRVAGNDLIIDGIDLLMISLSLVLLT